MSWKTLRPQIATLVETIDKIQEVSKAPKIKFKGYPAAHIVPSENSGDYETTSENIRTYSFTLRLFYDTKQNTIENAMLALEDIVDNALDLFDKEDLKGSTDRTIGIGLPSGYTFINIFASPNRWGVLTEEQLLMAEIAVRVRVSIDIS